MVLFTFKLPSLFLILLLTPHVDSVFFNFTGFMPNMNTISFQGDAFASSGVIQVTKNQRNGALTNSAGRASFSEPIQIWDAKTKKLTDFTTHFTFVIDALNSSSYGDGLSFFLAPFHDDIPNNSFGGFLGLFNNSKPFNSSSSNSVKNGVVAVEFDTYQDTWDPSDDHIGINVDSIVSARYVKWKSTIKNGSKGNAWVSYNSSTKNLSVYLTYAENPVFGGSSSVWHVVDLREILPERVRVGFSASTGDWIELHSIISWSFRSNLEIDSFENKKWLVIGLVVSITILAVALGIFAFALWKKKALEKTESCVSFEEDDDSVKSTGPKRFTFNELMRATKKFSEEGKLGEGGFGCVYKGFLSSTSSEVAVKRISRGSKQGKKEYASEIRIISRLRHRNLVQLVGWCHEKDEFLLVYEYMPNRSLDSHLFSGVRKLTWTVRYKIAMGLASALLYLHEEWEQCVVHRDVKSSNVMLDSNYNAKLGDFGLARLVDHELGSQTTVLAGTMGYLAPECLTTGKASKESDVYSFGVVALEITCGRKPVEPKADPSQIRLVEWVWKLYGKGQILDAADKGLNADFDARQMECLMVVGLWCCHPDLCLRPSIKQVINVLNFEAPLPSLSSHMPVPMYYAPPMDMLRFSFTSSVRATGSGSDHNPTQTTRSNSRSSMSAAFSKPQLQLRLGRT